MNPHPSVKVVDLTDADTQARWKWLKRCMIAWESGFDHAHAGMPPVPPAAISSTLRSSWDAGYIYGQSVATRPAPASPASRPSTETPDCLRPYAKVGPGNNWSCDAYHIGHLLYVCREDDSTNWTVVHRDVNEDPDGQELSMMNNPEQALQFALESILLETDPNYPRQ